MEWAVVLLEARCRQWEKVNKKMTLSCSMEMSGKTEMNKEINLAMWVNKKI